MHSNRTALVSLFFIWLVTASQGITSSNIVDLITTGSYSNHLANLYTHIGESRGFTHNNDESPRVPAYQHDLARDYMVSNFNEWGYDTWLDPFSFTYTSGHTYTGCNNVVATKWGHGGTNVYFLIAHYDSVDKGHRSVNIGPGADDGASGVAAQLEIAEVIQDYIFKDTIVILACDAEEKDYRGSLHFVNTHITDDPAETNSSMFLKSSIKAVVNLDTIAYDDTNTPHYVVMGRVNGFSQAAFAVRTAMNKYTSLTALVDSEYNQSDHKSFYDIGLDAIHVIEYDFHADAGDTVVNPWYHSDYDAIDQPDYLRMDYATEVTKGILGAICDYATPILPATLNQSISNNTITLSWITTPGVEYDLYSTENLSSNTWNLITQIDATNEVTARTIQFDLNSVSGKMFRVLSH